MSKPTIRAAILVRVSTKSQDTGRQRYELEEEAKKRGWEVMEVIEEKVSGRADEEERTGLIRLRELMDGKKIDRVMVHEITRLGRRSSIVHKFIEDMTGSGVGLYWHAQGMETLLPNGKVNGVASVIIALLAEMGRAETDLLRERIQSGLAEARRRGVVLGRKPGAVSAGRFLEKNGEVVELVKRKPGLSVRDYAKLAGVSPGLIMKVRKVMGGHAK